MLPVSDSFEVDYHGSEIIYGRGRINRLGEILDERGLERALVVCGSNVGSNDEVTGPIREGLGDRLVGIFDETTPDKRIETVFDGIDLLRRTGADVLIGVGGGSSLDITRQMSIFADDGRSVSDIKVEASEGRVEPPASNGPLTSVVVVPTTLAGADLSSGGSLLVLPPSDSPTGEPIRIGGRLMPDAFVYDPAMFETTPIGAIEGSAINGFNKGLERIYSKNPTAITDATAVYGLRLLQQGLPKLSDDDAAAMDRAVTGIILVQFNKRISIIHAFGHGFSRWYPVHQGVIHAVLVPHVLRYIFDNVNARRALLAEAFDIDPSGRSPEEIAEEIVTSVEHVRDGLSVPTRLRDVEAIDTEDFPAIAEFIINDSPMKYIPKGLDPTVRDIEAILHEAW